jgi:hypothetical protein
MILKIQGKFSEIFWNWRNPKKVFGAHYKIILELHGRQWSPPGNIGVEAEFAEDEKHGRKSSPNHRRNFAGTQAVHDKLRREVEGATSGGSR